MLIGIYDRLFIGRDLLKHTINMLSMQRNAKCAYFWNSQIPFSLFLFLCFVRFRFSHSLCLSFTLSLHWAFEAPVCCQAVQNNHDHIICMVIDCHRFVRQLNTESESRAQPQWTLRNDDCSLGIPIKLIFMHSI